MTISSEDTSTIGKLPYKKHSFTRGFGVCVLVAYAVSLCMFAANAKQCGLNSAYEAETMVLALLPLNAAIVLLRSLTNVRYFLAMLAVVLVFGFATFVPLRLNTRQFLVIGSIESVVAAIAIVAASLAPQATPACPTIWP